MTFDITAAEAVVAFAVVVVLIAAALWGPTYLRREKPTAAPAVERYGPPPGGPAVDRRPAAALWGPPGATTASAIRGAQTRT